MKLEKITKNQIIETAEKYGLEVTQSKDPGLFLSGEKIEMFNLVEDLLEENDYEFFYPVNPSVTKINKSKVSFNQIDNHFDVERTGAA
ncbi:hypothetical protein [Salipaludibacillus sp. CF4.18]|uniref:hypothetical protein n=1 Tax=Salipaludibacillus sp. CF4.18 TaxID=3373081 RepID=UPI003EE6D748